MNKQFLGITILAVIALLTACSGLDSLTKKNGESGPAKNSEGSLSDPKGSIAYQLELIKAGNAEKLRACCFTDRVKDRVTNEAVEKAKSDAGKYTIDDLVGSVEMGEYEGKKTAKIKMKNGKTLTTLVQTNNNWLADTIWFD